jgi:hypothetical protein
MPRQTVMKQILMFNAVAAIERLAAPCRLLFGAKMGEISYCVK